MTFSRQTFLRFTGIAFLTGAARKLTAALTPARWAMVIDPAACARQPNCTKCITACHQAHNVPSIPDPRHEIHWLAEQPFARVFPGQEDEYSRDRAAARHGALQPLR